MYYVVFIIFKMQQAVIGHIAESYILTKEQ